MVRRGLSVSHSRRRAPDNRPVEASLSRSLREEVQRFQGHYEKSLNYRK
jgi:hypothetical protein